MNVLKIECDCHCVRGVVLITSREILQQYKTSHVIKINFVNKCLEMLAEITELNEYDMESYEQFGKCLKLGTHEDSSIRAKIANCRGSTPPSRGMSSSA